MREVINLFSESESRDELGVGQVRDAFSDLLFPGTSTLHRRARYLLLIPWCYQAALPRAANADDLERRAAINERKLIATYLNAGVVKGLIGREAGPKLKTLPSALYWSALAQYGIRVGDLSDALASTRSVSEADELVERAPRMWNVLPVPDGFPDADPRLDLSAEEAAWLKERMIGGSRGSLLEQLLLGDFDGFAGPGPWDVASDDPDIRQTLDHARRFSATLNAAALTYNLAIAERYEAAGHRRQEDPILTYRELIERWHQENGELVRQLPEWDFADMWSRVAVANPNVRPGTVAFVEAWVALLSGGGRADDEAAIRMIATRERLQKRNQSRLENPRLLENWSGGSGTGPFNYRWSNVAVLVTDIRQGLSDAPA
jgi:hypothetical protein